MSSNKIALLLCAAGAPLVSLPAIALEPARVDEVVVTASPIGRSAEETILGTSAIDGAELEQRLANSIGETLRREPGVSSTFFGPGASRPVIRGLGGDRIRVLNAGIGSIDASAASPDHAVAVEPATAERIEIVRGTSMLLYGSSAAGGVVNVFDGRIPTESPEGGLDGALRIGGSTVDSGVEAAGGFDVSLGRLGAGELVFHGDGSFREAEDYKIPGFVESAALRAQEEEEGEEHEEKFGLVENSAFETKGGGAGLSWIFENGFIGFSASATDTFYGVPAPHGHGHDEHEEDDHDEDHDDHDEHEDHDDHDDHEEHEEGGVSVDLKQRRYDLRGEINGDFGPFKTARLRVGYADYEHAEIEPSGEIGTVFENAGWEGRLELVESPFSALGGEINGAVGFQWLFRDFSAIGEEAFTPPTKSEQYGFFVLEEYSSGPWRLELGGRYENTKHRVQETGFERSFDGFSVSAGAGVKPAESVFLGITGFRTERAPSTEELFSNGPHLATGSFEVGDPDLDEETALGVEATARFRTERISLSFNAFYTSYDDFIFQRRTGEEEDELPVFEYTATDAVFRGMEAEISAELAQYRGFDIHADAAIDYVRAVTKGQVDNDLPRIPPVSGLVGLEARSSHFDLRFELEYALDQDRVAEFELPTPGYAAFNTFITLRPFGRDRDLSVLVSAENLTNEEIRLHTSRLKDIAPLPGRNFRVALRGGF